MTETKLYSDFKLKNKRALIINDILLHSIH